MQFVLNIELLEKNLRIDAKRFVSAKLGYIEPRARMYDLIKSFTGVDVQSDKSGPTHNAAADIISKLLIRERKRGQIGRASYSLDRHLALHQVQKFLQGCT